MAAPIYYRWDDANAPVARGERTSMIEILTACLVTGYGSKPPAGWTKQFANAEGTKAVFRNDPARGTGSCLRVDGASTASANLVQLLACEVAQSLDDVLFPFFTETGLLFYMSNQSGTRPHPWILIADDRAFRLQVWPTITNISDGPIYAGGHTLSDDPALQCISLFFGDCVPFFPDDRFFSCFSVGTFVSGYFLCGGVLCAPASAGAATWPTAYATSRNRAGMYAPTMASLCCGGGPTAPNSTGYYGPARADVGTIIVQRPFINTATPYGIRGYVPGLYAPCHPADFSLFEIVEVAGKQMLSLFGWCSSGSWSYLANYFISLDDWWV